MTAHERVGRADDQAVPKERESAAEGTH